MIKELIRLANHLDQRGLTKEADYLDVVSNKYFLSTASEETSKERAIRNSVSRITESIANEDLISQIMKDEGVSSLSVTNSSGSRVPFEVTLKEVTLSENIKKDTNLLDLIDEGSSSEEIDSIVFEYIEKNYPEYVDGITEEIFSIVDSDVDFKRKIKNNLDEMSSLYKRRKNVVDKKNTQVASIANRSCKYYKDNFKLEDLESGFDSYIKNSDSLIMAISCVLNQGSYHAPHEFTDNQMEELKKYKNIYNLVYKTIYG